MLNSKFFLVLAASVSLATVAQARDPKEEPALTLQLGARIHFKLKQLSPGQLSDTIGDKKMGVHFSLSDVDSNKKLAEIHTFTASVPTGETKTLNKDFSLSAREWNALLRQIDPAAKKNLAFTVALEDSGFLWDTEFARVDVGFDEVISDLTVLVFNRGVEAFGSSDLGKAVVETFEDETKKIVDEFAKDIGKDFPKIGKSLEKTAKNIPGMSGQLKDALTQAANCTLNAEMVSVSCPYVLIDAKSGASAQIEITIDSDSSR